MTNKEKVEFVKRNFENLTGMVCFLESNTYHSLFTKGQVVRIMEAERRSNAAEILTTATGATVSPTEVILDTLPSENINKNYEFLVSLLDDNNVTLWVKIRDLSFIASTKEDVEIMQNSFKEKVKRLEDYKQYMEANNISRFDPVEYYIKSLMKDLGSSNPKAEEILLQSINTSKIYYDYYSTST